MTEVIAAAWAAGAQSLGDAPGFAAVYLPNGRAPAAGETFANPALGAAYELLATGGRDAFYRGPIGAALSEQVRAHGGFVSADDLAAHRSEWVEPVVDDLSRLARVRAAAERAGHRGAADAQHPRRLRSRALAVRQRRASARAARSEEARVRGSRALLRRPRVRARAGRGADLEGATRPRAASTIDPRRASAAPGHGDPLALRAGDTIYLTTADEDGNMVSLIQSNYSGFGSGVTVERFGFGLQNRGSSFALEDGHANVYEPGKRPFHTIIPAFAIRAGSPTRRSRSRRDADDALLSFGVMGAAMQPQGHVQVLTNMVDFGMNPQEAGDAPRVRHEGSTEPTGGAAMSDGGVVHLESGFAPAALEGLRARGHAIAPERRARRRVRRLSGDPARRRAAACTCGASESRKDGHAAGY